MPTEPRGDTSGIVHGLFADRMRLGFVALAVVLTAYVVGYPFTQATYPPLTDLPFHAAETSILRHYFDPAFGFREQFTVHPLEVPYVAMYAIGALLALFAPIAVATKVMAISMLLLVPAGLAVLLHGMKKSPLWGLSGLALTWGTVTQWGFLNFMGAVGLFAMSVGFALLVVDAPSRLRQVGLAASLVGIFFTHVFRLPFAILAVLLAGAVLHPATRRFRPLLPALVPAVLLFGLWLVVRPRGLGIGAADLGFDVGRFRDVPKHLFGAYLPLEMAPPSAEGNEERMLAKWMLATLAAAALAISVPALGAWRARPPAERRWAAGVTALPLLLAGGFLLGYVTLPYEVGYWFYVYPREIVPAALLLLAAVPDLPRRAPERVVVACLLAAASVPMARFVATRFREFETRTADFRQVVAEMPRAPRLFHLVYWLGGSAKRVSPFLHLPAWIQAEKGGALGFHFVQWGHTPIRYRPGSSRVPPSFEERFEWTPERFRVAEHGPWFDTFLVRHTIDPTELFDADPEGIRLVSHRGTWWLYRRQAP